MYIKKKNLKKEVHLSPEGDKKKFRPTERAKVVISTCDIIKLCKTPLFQHVPAGCRHISGTSM